MPQFIDTHAHLYLDTFEKDQQEVMDRATVQHVTDILLPAIDAASHEALLRMAQTFSNAHAMMGVHPCSIKENYKEELAIAEAYLNESKCIAIGEIGLDFYWDTTFAVQQYESFETQLGWALQKHLPVSIHSRNALDECIATVQKFKGLRGVFHCFTGSVAQAEKIMDMGLYLGIGGVVTYKKSGLDAVVKAVGLSKIVLETDAPYLTPVPYRGKRNESSYLTYVAQHLAQTLDCDIETIAEGTTQNAKALFGLA